MELEADPLAALTADAAMQGYWYMEEAAGATRLDGSSKANHLTSVNTVGQSSTRKQGSFSASFAKASSMRLLRTEANLPVGFPGKNGSAAQDLTVGCWCQFSSQTGNLWLISKGERYTIYYNGTAKKFQAELYDGGTYKSTLSDTTYATNNVWIHVALRFLGTSTRELALYVNGVKQAVTITAASGITACPEDFSIGATWLGGSAWDGLIDEAWILNRALSDAEILTVYTSGLAAGGAGGAAGHTAGPSHYLARKRRRENLERQMR